MTPSVGPNFPFSEHTLFARWWSLARNWVLSTNWIFCNCICRPSFAGMWIAIVAGYFSSRFNCVVVNTFVSESASWWRLEFCTFGSMPMIAASLEVYTVSTVCLSWRTFTRKFLCACLHFRHHQIFSSPFEFRCCDAVGESEWSRPFLFWVMLECARISKWTLASRDPTNAISSLGVVLSFVFAFSFRFSFARSSSCRSVLVSIARFDMRILHFCSSRICCHQISSLEHWVGIHFNSSDFSTCTLYRLSNMMSVGLSATADNTSSHFLSKAWTLSFVNWTFDKPRD